MPNLLPSLTLYHDELSLGSRVVLLVIRNLSLDVNVQQLNLLNGHRNPEMTAPTLIDHNCNNFTLYESRAISSYLVETHRNGNSLFPNDIVRRAVINQRLYFDANTLIPRMDEITQPIMLGHTREVSQEKKHRLKEALTHLNGFLELDKWVAGGEATIADLTIVCAVSALKELGARVDEYRFVQEWLENCQVLSGFTEMENGARNWAQGVKDRMIHGIN